MINLYIYLNIYQIYQILPVYLQSTSYTRYNDTHKKKIKLLLKMMILNKYTTYK